MQSENDSPLVLLAEDDAGDRVLITKAWERVRPGVNLHFVEDGQELLEYLNRQGEYVDPESAPAPLFIVLDLNMPRIDGREALQQIKSDERLKKIPVVVLTTSQEERDVEMSYHLGANAYVKKPLAMDELVEALRAVDRFWIETAEVIASE